MAREEVPNTTLPRLTAIPAARSKAAVLKVRFWLVLSVLLFAAGAGVFAAVSFLTFQPPVVDLEAEKPLGRAVAELAVNDFLSGGEILVPEVRDQNPPTGSAVEVFGPLVWDRFTKSLLPNGVPVELHTFLVHRSLRGPTVVDESGATIEGERTLQLMEVSVLVATPVDTNPAVAARPYMIPAVYSDLDVRTDYSDSTLLKTLPGPAINQLRAWGSAWARDDSEQLKLLTGDQTPNVRYVGLGGYSLNGMSVISALEFAPDEFVVRARVGLRSANGSILEMDMDLTITAASSGLPKVVGWGPAGSGLRRPESVRVPFSG